MSFLVFPLITKITSVHIILFSQVCLTMLIQVNLLLASGSISSYVSNKEEPLFRHTLNSTLKPQLVPPSAQDAKGGSFLYTLKGDDGLYYCHLFKAKDSSAVSTFLIKIVYLLLLLLYTCTKEKTMYVIGSFKPIFIRLSLNFLYIFKY